MAKQVDIAALVQAAVAAALSQTPVTVAKPAAPAPAPKAKHQASFAIEGDTLTIKIPLATGLVSSKGNPMLAFTGFVDTGCTWNGQGVRANVTVMPGKSKAGR